MPLRFSSGLVKKMVDTSPVRTLLTGGKILIFAGAQTTTADDAVVVTPLITITGITFDTDGSGGILRQTAATDWTGTITLDGTAGWFRICESADTGLTSSSTLCRMDGSIATSGGQMNLASLTFTNGAPFTITDAQITFPKE